MKNILNIDNLYKIYKHITIIMCGIFGYIGYRNASKLVIEGLKSLDYRGYDSWGIATQNNPSLQIVKDVGKIEYCNDFGFKQSKLAIGHTRWATHGKVTKINAHPHTSCDAKIAVVHNGIVENYQELKKELKHHKFISETDSEVIPHLIEEYLKTNSYVDAVKKALRRLEGRFAVLIINLNHNELIAARRGSPLIIGIDKNEFFASSDVLAFISHTNKVVYLEDDELVLLNDTIKVFNLNDDKIVNKNIETIEWNLQHIDKQGYEHYMLKEILEQNLTVTKAITQDDLKLRYIAEKINHSGGTFFIGCGTAGNAALTASYLFSKITNKHVNFCIASEFPNYKNFLNKDSLIIAISQSGETADVLEAVKFAKEKNASILSIVNVIGSSLNRASDYSFITNAGPEKCVLATKSFTSQISLLILLAYACNNMINDGKLLLSDVSRYINSLFRKDYIKHIEQLAEKIKQSKAIYVIGRGLNYPTALEAALKIKEVSYIHAEGFAGGELKHGVIALIEDKTPCIVLVADDENKNDIISNAIEMKSRGAFIIGVAPENNEIFDYFIKVPNFKLASPIINIIPIQLLAYYLAVKLGKDPDKPRNLAKSVTVK